MSDFDIPFYASDTDNDPRRTQAIYRMVIGYFLHKELTHGQLEELTGHRSQRAGQSVKALTAMARGYGLDVRMIEPFDYKKFASRGIVDKQLITEFLALVHPEHRQPTLHDIDEMLDEGRLVLVRLTNGNHTSDPEQTGATPHSVLVVSHTENGYVIHDPGLPPHPHRQLSKQELWQAMGGEDTDSEVTGFMLRTVGSRLDQYVIRERPNLSRAYATRLIKEGRVLVNGQSNKPGYKLRKDDTIHIDYNEADEPAIPDIDLPIIYEDEDCVVINKPAGVLTHNKGVRFIEATVASFIQKRARAMDGARPGIVHRLDRATSGVIICAKTPEALSWLQRQFHDRAVQKHYAAIIAGVMEPRSAMIDMPIERNPKAPATFRVGANGKTAQTYYETVATSDDGNYSLLELQPKTGRTHQLRVHTAYRGHPIVGDVLYDGQTADRLYLHAHTLHITLPNGQRKTFEAPIPPEFHAMLKTHE